MKIGFLVSQNLPPHAAPSARTSPCQPGFWEAALARMTGVLHGVFDDREAQRVAYLAASEDMVDYERRLKELEEDDRSRRFRTMYL